MLTTHYYNNRNKVIQLKFHCFNEKPPWKDKDFNVSNNILFADLKYPSPLIVRTNPFRHVIHKALTLNFVTKDNLSIGSDYFQVTPVYNSLRFYPSQFPHCSAHNADFVV